jgi:starch synthase
VGILPKVLRRKGYDVRLVLPYYSAIITEAEYTITHEMDLTVTVGRKPVPASVYKAELPAPADGEVYPVYLVGDDPHDYFARVNGKDVPIYPRIEDGILAGELYTFFCQAALEMAGKLFEQGWKPDIIHCHDWPTGLIPVYLKDVLRDKARLAGLKVIFTVHNISVECQGRWFDAEILQYAGIPQKLYQTGRIRHDERVNFMKAGIVFSDRVNTVSEGYAEEIKSDIVESFVNIRGERRQYQYSGGLDYVWSLHSVNLVGIRNGIDDSYGPSTIGQGADWKLVDEDWKAKYKPAKGKSVAGWAYSAADAEFQRKKKDLKLYLQKRCNRLLKAKFAPGEDIPIIAVRSRLAEQKGFDLVIEGLEQWDFKRPAQFIIIAWGTDPQAVEYGNALEYLARRYPSKIAFSQNWKDVPEPLHYAGADFLLMPSLFEPCGLPHMMALRYGTIPIVRRTGGLADVVQDFDPAAGEGNGFDFIAPDYREMLKAIDRALLAYKNQNLRQKLLNNAIKAEDRKGQDFTWNTSVDRYIADLYS